MHDPLKERSSSQRRLRENENGLMLIIFDFHRIERLSDGEPVSILSRLSKFIFVFQPDWAETVLVAVKRFYEHPLAVRFPKSGAEIPVVGSTSLSFFHSSFDIRLILIKRSFNMTVISITLPPKFQS